MRSNLETRTRDGAGFDLAPFPRLAWSNPEGDSIIRPEKKQMRLALALIQDYGAFAEIEAHERTIMLVNACCFRGAQRWASVRTLVRRLRAGSFGPFA
ncbi:MAG: hypothetical protein ACKVRO_06885 [Micropepsaceae bacterium]